MVLRSTAVILCISASGLSQDPAPPFVHELDPIEAPAARSHDGLTFHRAPRALSKAARTEDWPGFLGMRTDSHSRETHLLRDWGQDGPTLVWEMRRGQGYASPAIADGRVVFTHRSGATVHVDCLEAETGKRFWRFSHPCDYRGRYISNYGPRSTPVISDGRVYVHGVAGGLHCLELSTGRVVWRRDPAKEFAAPADFFGVVSSPIIHGNLLICQLGAPKATVAAFDKRSGRLVWASGSAWGPSCCSPVVATVGKREWLLMLAGGESRPPAGGLMLIDPATGRLATKYPFRAKIYESVTGSTPAVGRGWAFITSSYGAGSAVLSLDESGAHEERWKSRRIGLQFSNAVVDDEKIWAIDGRSDRAGAIVCIDPKNGKELSRTDIELEETVEYKGKKRQISMSIGEGSLLHADGGFLCLGDNGHLLWLDATPAGTKIVARHWLFRANESWTPMALSRGLLYVCQNKRERFGDAPRRLLCYDLRGN